jgi:hypothetical protein
MSSALHTARTDYWLLDLSDEGTGRVIHRWSETSDTCIPTGVAFGGGSGRAEGKASVKPGREPETAILEEDMSHDREVDEQRSRGTLRKRGRQLEITWESGQVRLADPE